jgi:hypothetical protein
MTWRIDIKAYCRVLVTETPLTNKLKFVEASNVSGTSDRMVEECIPAGYQSFLFSGTNKDLDVITDWITDIGDLKIIGIHKIPQA